MAELSLFLAFLVFFFIVFMYDRRFSKRSRELQLNEQFYKSLLDQNPDSILTFDLHGKFLSANQAVSTLFGYQVEDLLNKPFTTLILPDDLDKAIEHFKKAAQGTTTTYELSVYDYEGNPRVISGTSIPIVVNRKIIGVYAIIKDITEHKKAQKMIKHMAYHDQLTDLPNRYMLREKLNEVVTDSKINNENFALLFIDLDRFKAVNDSLGHEIGDKLLMEIADRLKSCTIENDIISRYGGDEFTVLLPDTNVEKARDAAKSILTALSEPFHLNHQEIVVTPSIGISIFPEHGENFDTLVKNADLAMYFAKSLGKNNFQFFTCDLLKKSQYEIDMEAKLRKALERNEFQLFYQPQMNLQTNRMIGVEALIRWVHPEKGMVSPCEFIPLAEETGLIIPIGEWALRTACKQNKIWQDAGLPRVTVSVNISAKQFFQSNLAEVVENALNESGLEPKYLELEITESMTMDVERSISTLLDLKKIGVNVSIDDFGTGYSSLNYLKRFPIDKLKIDQTFIWDCTTDQHDQTIVKTIISMAHNLKLKVIAEGVETKEHVSFLLQQMCTEAQGYYFSKPLSVADLENHFFIGENWENKAKP